MPEVSRFHGIRIHMFFNDHVPAHVHAYFAEHEARIAIRDGAVIAGSLPDAALRRVRRWLSIRRSEVTGAWARVVRHEAPGTIEPLP